ncbi:DUF6190 family protein [Streptosporangium sp. NPDC001559]|uniref:DUF6190 family protein n=1 Tax=Streptosporangium sp. NPDC001559 TaxID=3366187 RepID=UPI0036EF105A
MTADLRPSPTGPEAYVDAALFMGMNSADEATRIACKSFFAARLNERVVMSLEQVGRCDDLVWRFPREVQDAYYPFMDNLHTDMNIERRGYEPADLREDLGKSTGSLPAHERLLLGMVVNRGGVLHSASPRLLSLTGVPVLAPVDSAELSFPEPLERLYQASLMLRVPVTRL